MKFYSSVHQHRGKLLVTRFENGRRIKEKVPYAPYLFVSGKDGDYKTVFGEPVSRVDFDSTFAAKEFIKKYDGIQGFKFHGLSNWQYQYIYDNFEQSVYDRKTLNVGMVDIETDVEGGYPDTDVIQGEKEITMISLYCNGEMWSFGLKDFDTTDLPHVRYFKFDTEEAMLRRFLRVWQALELDIVTGWNIQGFDIPYIIERLRRVLGEEMMKRLSPWGLIEEREFLSPYGKMKKAYTIVGIAEMDYMQLYIKFIVPLKGRPESFSLDYISAEVLGIRKLDYSEYGNLGELYKKNPQLYAEYNVRDVDLIWKLDDALGLIDIALTIAYQTGCNLSDVFGTVRPWDCAIHRYLMDQKIVVPYEKLTDRSFKIEGGYVKTPINGMHKWVASFDFASLYPHVIMMWNIGPETFKRRIDTVRADKIVSGEIDIESILGENEVLGGNGCIFDTSKVSFLHALMKEKFADRSRYKDLMLASQKLAQAATTPEEKAKHEADAVRYDNLQHATKILLNSLYGSLANEYNRWFDPYLAECITQSGQAATKWVEVAINKFLNKLLKSVDDDFVIACDTDSAYVTCEKFIDAIVKDQSDVKKVIGILDEFCKNKLTPVIQEACAELGRILHAPEQKLNMKRECLANKGIWTGKKHYILNVYDKEGVSYDPPKRKITGIEAVRSSTPGAARTRIVEAISRIMDQGESDLQSYVAAVREEYRTLPVSEISFPRGVNDIEKWSSKQSMFIKGCPIQAKSAIYFNHLLEDKGIRTYAPIKSGDKIKFTYLDKRNPYGIEVLGFPAILPPEFQMDEFVDRTKQFEKGFLEPIKSIVNVIGWNAEPTATLEAFFL